MQLPYGENDAHFGLQRDLKRLGIDREWEDQDAEFGICV